MLHQNLLYHARLISTQKVAPGIGKIQTVLFRITFSFLIKKINIGISFALHFAIYITGLTVNKEPVIVNQYNTRVE